jgi:hypothetical protein
MIAIQGAAGDDDETRNTINSGIKATGVDYRRWAIDAFCSGMGSTA